MEIITVEEKISLHPKYICSDIKKILYDKLNTDYKNKCLQKSGYIIKIYNDFTILNNNIYSSTNSIVLNVRISMKVLKPDIGTKLNVNVIHVLKNGILTECQNVLKIFIPAININNMNFDSLKNCFTDNETSIFRSDTIEIEISKVRYENNKFDCIGFFVKKIVNVIINNQKTELINEKFIESFNNQLDLVNLKENNKKIRKTKEIGVTNLINVKEEIHLVELKETKIVKEKKQQSKKNKEIEEIDLVELKENKIVKEKKQQSKKNKEIEEIDLTELKENKIVKEKKKQSKKNKEIEEIHLTELKEKNIVKEKKKQSKKNKEIEEIHLTELKENNIVKEKKQQSKKNKEIEEIDLVELKENKIIKEKKKQSKKNKEI